MKKITMFLFALIATCAIQAWTFVDYYSSELDLMKDHKFEQAIESFDKVYQSASAQSQERSRVLAAKGTAIYRIALELNLAQNYKDAYAKYSDAMKLFRRVQARKECHGLHLFNGYAQ